MLMINSATKHVAAVEVSSGMVNELFDSLDKQQ